MATDQNGTRVLRYALVLGLAVRLLVLVSTSTLDTKIVDEQQYAQLAVNLQAGNGLAWAPGNLTSIRPPLYPGFLAAVWSIAGAHNLQAIRILQILIALATTGLVYQLGLRTYGSATGRYAAAIFWLYPSFIFFNVLILTETVFTFLFIAFVLTSIMIVQRPRVLTALACGVCLALAALTRSVLWPVPLILCPLLVLIGDGPLARRLAASTVVLVVYVGLITPWAIRNTRLQGVVTIVDTMGGINLRMGNYEYTPDDRMWDAVSLTGDKSWVNGFSTEAGQPPTEGRKDKWAQRKAIEYMIANPGITLRRSLIKFSDFWGLEREFIAGVEQGLYSPPKWIEIVSSVLIVASYVLIVIMGAIGMWLTPPPDWRSQVLLLFPIVLFVAAHSIIFGHSRYHLPLMPLLGIYAAQLMGRLSTVRVARRPMLVGATATVCILATIWIRQIVLVDLSRIREFFHQIS